VEESSEFERALMVALANRDSELKELDLTRVSVVAN
jgi:hypothetical protein